MSGGAPDRGSSAARTLGALRSAPPAWHLVRRFFAVLRSGAPSVADEAWARRRLTEDEWALWRRHRPTDRRHTIAVARHVLAGAASGVAGGEGGASDGAARTGAGGATVPPWVVAAALMHDIGKVQADLGVPGRVVASVLAAGRVRTAPGMVGRYLRYPQLGAELLRGAGSDPLVAAWAAEHHLPVERWTVPAPWARRLAAADDAAV